MSAPNMKDFRRDLEHVAVRIVCVFERVWVLRSVAVTMCDFEVKADYIRLNRKAVCNKA